mgnify:CR=1 FL=1
MGGHIFEHTVSKWIKETLEKKDGTYEKLKKECSLKAGENLKDFVLKNLNLDNNQLLELFPNPATNYFQIGNGGLVDRVDIFNLLGKNVKTVFRNDAAQYEISELNAGIYLVKMYDANRKLIKTVKLYRE